MSFFVSCEIGDRLELSLTHAARVLTVVEMSVVHVSLEGTRVGTGHITLFALQVVDVVSHVVTKKTF